MRARQSLQRQGTKLLRRLSEALGAPRNLPKDNDIVRYQGVSIRFLKELSLDIVEGRAADGVELFVLLADFRVDEQTVLRSGCTVRKNKECVNGRAEYIVPYVGLVKLDSEQIREKPRTEWTIEDVCEFVVLEQTRKSNSFYLDILDSSDVGKRFQGAFVSQARKSNFGDLVQSILGNSNTTVEFVWLDIFSANQPLLTDPAMSKDIQSSRGDLLKFGLHHALCAFDDRWIYFNSWIDPFPLTRAWCVWEIYGAAKSGKHISILYKPGEQEAFLEALQHDQGAITKSIMNINLAKAECFNNKDKMEIDKAVEEGVGGYHKLNVQISGLVNTWMKDFTQDVVKQLQRDDTMTQESRINVLFAVAGFWCTRGDFENGLTQYRQVLKLREKLHGTRQHQDIASTLHAIATATSSLGDYDKALDQYREALKICEIVRGTRHHSDVATTLHGIAHVMQAKGDYEGALQHYREALSIDELIYGTNEHPEVVSTLREIAHLTYLNGDYDSALEQYNEVLQIDEKMHGTREDPSVAYTLHAIANVMNSRGDYDGALEHYRAAFKIYEQIYGTRDHPEVAATLHNIAHVMDAKGDYKGAIKQHREVLAIKEKVYGTRQHPDVATTLNALAHIMNTQGDYEGALRQYREVLEIREETFGSRLHPNVADTLHAIASVMNSRGDYEGALNQFREVRKIYEKVYGTRNHPYVAFSMSNIGVMLCRTGKVKDGVSILQEAQKILEEKQDKRYLMLVYVGLGIAYRLDNQTVQSLAELAKALSLHLEMVGKRRNLGVATILFEMGLTKQQQQKPEEARTLLEEALQIRKALITPPSTKSPTHSQHHPRLAEVLRALEQC